MVQYSIADSGALSWVVVHVLKNHSNAKQLGFLYFITWNDSVIPSQIKNTFSNKCDKTFFIKMHETSKHELLTIGTNGKIEQEILAPHHHQIFFSIMDSFVFHHSCKYFTSMLIFQSFILHQATKKRMLFSFDTNITVQSVDNFYCSKKLFIE